MAMDSHVPVFSAERLRKVEGISIAFSELRSGYEIWCAERRESPLSLPRFAAALKALGYEKWKSSGLIRYRGLQLAERSAGSHEVTLHPQSNLRDESSLRGPAKDRQNSQILEISA
jgi:hypothetical protein